ncbi:MAG: hypothetical protein R2771_08655 [Saprospiraceae bacterium]
MWGISLGVPFLNYSTDRYYTEVAGDELVADPDYFFSDLSYETGYSTVGVGINAKAGIIAKLPQNIRVDFQPTLQHHTDSKMIITNIYM